MKTLALFQSPITASPETKQQLIAQALQEDPITTIAVIFFLSDQHGDHELITQFHYLVVDHLSSYDEFFDSYLRLLPHIPDVSSWELFYLLYGAHTYIDMHILSIAQTAIVDFEDSNAISSFPIDSGFALAFATFIGEDITSLDAFILAYTTDIPTSIYTIADYSSATVDTMQSCIAPYLPSVSAAF
jgi:hypothetical protein